jgi:hypothetical protein
LLESDGWFDLGHGHQRLVSQEELPGGRADEIDSNHDRAHFARYPAMGLASHQAFSAGFYEVLDVTRMRTAPGGKPGNYRSS